MKKSIFLLFAIVSVAGMIAISGCKKKETYTVTFNANGGTGTMQPQTFTEGEAQVLTRNAFTYDGYAFTGWNTVQGGSGASYTDGQTITATADMTLYAQWTNNGTNPTPGPTPSSTVTVTFDANGGTGEMAPQTFTIGTAHALAANMFSYDIFHFKNWNTAADGTGISYSDQQVVNPSASITLYAQWDGGFQNGHRFIDLGLPSGTKWALTNVGSDTPEGYGDYFRWGDTTANWGSGWRKPTKTELEELKNNCTVTWTTQNGVNGRLFTGPNGNSIFLPAAGSYYQSSLNNAGSTGSYWSSTFDTSGPWYLHFNSGNLYMNGAEGGYYTNKCTVRPVCVSAQN